MGVGEALRALRKRRPRRASPPAEGSPPDLRSCFVCIYTYIYMYIYREREILHIHVYIEREIDRLIDR